MTEMEEIEELFTLTESVRGQITQVLSVTRPNARVSKFDGLLTSYLKAKLRLEICGFSVPPIEISGKDKPEVIAEIVSMESIFNEISKTLSQRRSVLETEATYLKLVEQISTDDNHLASSSPDILVLNTAQNDLVQDKLDDLRNTLQAAEWETHEHKDRVLRSLNNLQRELDSRIGSYSRRLGQLVELGDAIGEFGKKTKPATDRVKDLMDSLRIFKKENAQIEKSKDPLKLEDMRKQDDE